VRETHRFLHWQKMSVGFLSFVAIFALTAGARSDDSAAAPARAPARLRWLPAQPKAARPTSDAPISQVIPAAAFQTVPLETLADDPSPPVDSRAKPEATEAVAPDKEPASKADAPAALKENMSSRPLFLQPPKPSAPPPAQPSPPRAEGGSAISQDIGGADNNDDACKKPNDVLRAISTITDDITAERGAFPPECPVTEANAQPSGPFRDRTAGAWKRTTFTWTASATCNKPLYFEQTQVERYGHSAGPILQPIVSAAHFFAAVPLLPYKMGVDPPMECQYSLGYYRPGSCAPYMIEPFPISLRGAFFEGAAVGTAIVVLQP
jgi:hypothetical protein